MAAACHLADVQDFFGYIHPEVIKIKGKEIRFEIGGEQQAERRPGGRLFSDSKILRLPPSYGIIHDPEGVDLPRCSVFFGPFKTTTEKVALDRTAKKYFGSNYPGVRATVDVPVHGNWRVVDSNPVVQIWYTRRGEVGIKGPHQGRFFHPFKKTDPPLILLHCQSCYCLELPSCIVNERGFVFP